MKHTDYNFVDTAMGNVDRRNVVITLAEVMGRVPANRVDCYCTWQRFPVLYQQHWASNIVKFRNGSEGPSVGGYKGPSYADFIPFDIDGETLEESQGVLQALVGYIETTWGETPMRFAFSGNRGYHTAIPAAAFGGWLPSEALAPNLKALALRLGEGLVDIDPKVYDRSRLWRLPNSINSKSGLYKIPLTRAEAFGAVSEIRGMAAEPRQLDEPDWDDAEPVDGLVELWGAVCAEKPKVAASAPVNVFASGLVEGERRQESAFNLARSMRGWGVPPSAAVSMLELWDGAQAESLKVTDGPDELERIVHNVYGDDPGRADRISPDVILSLDDIAEKYTEYHQLTKQRAINLGLPDLDRTMRGISPGETCTVIAKTSVGKTAFAQNVLRNVGQDQGAESLFLSMEQPAAQSFERWAQMTLGSGGSRVYDRWEDVAYRPELLAEMRKDALNRVWTCELPNLKMDEVLQLAWAAQSKAPNLGLIVIDYLGLIDAKDLDRTLYGQISEAARGMKNLAKTLNMAVMALCQISRSPDDHGDKPLHLSSARESGAIEEACDFLLGLYRPNIERLNGAEDDTMVIQLLKNRKGRTGRVECDFNPSTLTIAERPDVVVTGGSAQIPDVPEWVTRD